MNTSWLGFGLTGSITKTFLHFMPLSQGVGAPYPVNFSLTVGGSSLPSRTINIEGARLSQPDGFRIEDAIPALVQQASGLYYAKVEFDSAAHRLNLQSSSVSFELQYQQSSVPYRSVMIPQPADQAYSTKSAMALRDPNLYPMVLVINASGEDVAAQVLSYSRKEYAGSFSLQAESIREYEPAELGLRTALKLDGTSGSVEAELFQIVFDNPVKKGAAIAAFLVYRDRNSRRIASVFHI